MPRREQTWVRDMLDAARLEGSFIEGHTFESFKADLKSNNSTTFQMLIMGEAAQSVSEATCQKYPQIEWRKWKRLRDTIVHSYFTIDLKSVWDFANNEIPALISGLETLLEAEFGPQN